MPTTRQVDGASAGAAVMVNGESGGLPGAIVKAAVQHVLRRERKRAEIAITFLGPRAMRQLNRRFLHHDQVTDVIAFPITGPEGSVSGDVYVCRYAAARNAREHATSVREELLRLVVHGTLHVLGWDHPADSTRVNSSMWRTQERYLAELA